MGWLRLVTPVVAAGVWWQQQHRAAVMDDGNNDNDNNDDDNNDDDNDDDDNNDGNNDDDNGDNDKNDDDKHDDDNNDDDKHDDDHNNDDNHDDDASMTTKTTVTMLMIILYFQKSCANDSQCEGVCGGPGKCNPDEDDDTKGKFGIFVSTHRIHFLTYMCTFICCRPGYLVLNMQLNGIFLASLEMTHLCVIFISCANSCVGVAHSR